MPKISVIVPVYKAEAYLRECIDSILSQTFSDLEVILVEDGSPDNSGAICDEYAARETRISVIHQTNQGQAAARNHALAIAKGEWISFVDSDDRIHPQMLELLYQAVMQSGADISMCEMLESPELPEDFESPVDGVCEVLIMDEETLVRLHDAGDYPSWVACAKLIRKELVEQYPFCEGRVYEDNEAVCRWVCRAKTLARYSHRLYFYRTNPGSTTQRIFSLKKLDYLWALESITRFYASIGYPQMQKRFFDRYAEEAAQACYGLRYTLNRPDVVKEVEKNVRKFSREQNLRLSKAQFEQILDAAHPKLIRLYWPVAGAVQTLREEGFSGILRKLTKNTRKDGAE